MNANDQLKEFTGTENYYQYMFGMLITDGVKTLCERFECWWFLDIVCSYQPVLKQEDFQAWSLGVNEDGSAVVICTDGNDRILKTQDIPFTDFKAKESTVWCVMGVVLLPSEY
ncbi:MAG: hypothetical protein BGO70_02240 [Bacteroidetes bacterium 43-93]|nr:hypothetical protein [Bacteroidota bacterium]OJW99213.1 MAG: hypothetical protein BGO70_02240 [Bacteroidetes bacterium 43-93]